MPRLLRALLSLGGAAVLALLVSRVGVGVIADMLRRVGWGFAAVSGLYAIHLAVRGTALWMSLPHGSVDLTSVLRVRLSGEAVEMLTFTGPFLAEPAKGWMLEQSGVSAAAAYGGVAIEYLLYTLTSAWVSIAALCVLLARDALPTVMHVPVRIVIGGMVGLTAGVAVAAISGTGLVVSAVRGLRPLLGAGRVTTAVAKIEPVERVLVDFMHTRPGRLLGVLAVELAGHALLMLEIVVVARALGYGMSFWDPWLVEGSAKFISAAFFFIPGQVGAAEGIYTLLFEAVGLPAAAGLTMSLVRRVRALIVAGAGLGLLAWTGQPPGSPSVAGPTDTGR